jgi:hypothetical protein
LGQQLLDGTTEHLEKTMYATKFGQDINFYGFSFICNVLAK